MLNVNRRETTYLPLCDPQPDVVSHPGCRHAPAERTDRTFNYSKQLSVTGPDILTINETSGSNVEAAPMHSSPSIDSHARSRWGKQGF